MIFLLFKLFCCILSVKISSINFVTALDYNIKFAHCLSYSLNITTPNSMLRPKFQQTPPPAKRGC